MPTSSDATVGDASNQAHVFEARVALIAEDDVIARGNAERLCERDDLLRHLNVCARQSDDGRTVTDGTRMKALNGDRS
jgi:hypothetical protein